MSTEFADGSFKPCLTDNLASYFGSISGRSLALAELPTASNTSSLANTGSLASSLSASSASSQITRPLPTPVTNTPTRLTARPTPTPVTVATPPNTGVTATPTPVPSLTASITSPDTSITTTATAVTGAVIGSLSSTLSKAKSDFNKDGVSDLVQVDVSTKAISIALINGTTVSNTIALPASTTGWTPSGFGDFNNDGQWDLLARNYTTGANAIWLMNGTTLTQAIALPTLESADWLLSDAGDFNADGKWDLLWRNIKTGQNGVWLMDGTSPLRTATGEVVSLSLPTMQGTNLRITGTADFNQDGQTDILWHNYLTGENFVWLVKAAVPNPVAAPNTPASWTPPTVLNTVSLPSQPDVKWQPEAIGDFNYAKETADAKPHRPDLVWHNTTTGENRIWLMDSFTGYESVAITSATSQRNWVSGYDYNAIAPGTAIISDLSFSGKEGDTGTFKVKLAQAPTTNVTLTFSASDFLVVDADAVYKNGTQSTLTFTPQDWNQARTVWFIAENDASSTNRLNTLLNYTLSNTVVTNGTSSPVVTSSGAYDLGVITNTYAPDLTRFNIDLDFRNDPTGYWTLARRTTAQRAANDWASRIANEWTGLQLNNSIRVLDNGFYSSSTFTTKRYVDDLVVFVNPLSSGGVAGGYGGPEYELGGWLTSPDPMPRVGQIAIDPAVGDTYLYNAVLHELGHTLGMVGLNWAGYLQENLTTPQTAVFKGAYTKAANGGTFMPLMSQDGVNPISKQYDYWHPASSVQSIMSYGWIYKVSGPTAIDFAILADSGYKVTGINA
jgi:FG-GAP-like repeat